MHELSVGRLLLKQVLRIAAENRAQSVEEVRIRVGLFSGIEPLLLASAFEQLVAGSIASSARLEIEAVPLAVDCDACGRRFQPEGFRFQCPSCDSRQVHIVAGEELVLESVNCCTDAASEVP
jgi:hydrogenase nickel incorporation protein HypA/HybF